MTAMLPQQANVNIYISLSYLQQTNVRGPIFISGKTTEDS